MVIFFSLFLIIVHSQVTVDTKLTIDNCFDCASRDRNNYICHEKNKFSDPWQVSCCNSSNKTLSQCTPSAQNICSPTFLKAGFSFYTFCPDIKAKNCGIKNSEKLILYSDQEAKKFAYPYMRYTTTKYKIPRYEICYYQVKNPEFTYKSGNVSVEFKQIEKGAKLYVSAGSDLQNMSQIRPARINQNYLVEQSTSIILIAVPSLNSYNTSFEFSYYTDAKDKYSTSEILLMKFKNKDSTTMSVIYVIGAVIILIFIFICYLAWLRTQKKQITQIQKFDQNVINENQAVIDQYLSNRPVNIDEKLTIADKQDLFLESIGSIPDIMSNENSAQTQDPIIKPQIKKETKQAQVEELDNYYANPFDMDNKQRNQKRQEDIFSNR